MITIRKNVFETNSSSTHSLCLNRKGKLNIEKYKDTIFLPNLESYDWGPDILITPWEKLKYILVYLLQNYGYNQPDEFLDTTYINCDLIYKLETIKKYLNSVNIEFPYPDLDIDEYIIDKKTKRILTYEQLVDQWFCYDNYIAIDHQSWYSSGEFIEKLLRNKEDFLIFIFGDDNFIIIGTDNDDFAYDTYKERITNDYLVSNNIDFERTIPKYIDADSEI